MLSVDVDWQGLHGGLALPAGKCNCFLFCRRRISIVKLVAICSEMENISSIFYFNVADLSVHCLFTDTASGWVVIILRVYIDQLMVMVAVAARRELQASHA